MTRRIKEDHEHWRDLIRGRFRQSLRKHIKRGYIFRDRGNKDGEYRQPVDKLDLPHFRHGVPSDGVGRGKGKKGDIVDRDPQPGQGQGGGAGQGKGNGIEILVDLDDVIKILGEELSLPELKPKPNQLFEEIKIRYTDISLVGPESLRHNRRTILQALKRMAATGEIDELHYVPGVTDPIRLIQVINQDRRYRKYKEERIPSSNAAIFFMRDWSGSMSGEHCSIVSDMAYWLDLWIRSFYKKAETVYIGHDTIAEEVDQEKFYKYRGGGGTTCSSALKLMTKQFENRFPPAMWNIYGFYFTDGDNWDNDNQTFIECLEQEMPSSIVNMFGITQIMSYNYKNSLKEHIDTVIKEGKLPNVKTTSIGEEEDSKQMSSHWSPRHLAEDDRNEGIKKAIKDLLGAKQSIKMSDYATF